MHLSPVQPKCLLEHEVHLVVLLVSQPDARQHALGGCLTPPGQDTKLHDGPVFRFRCLQQALKDMASPDPSEDPAYSPED